jgi:hypothetical protein
VDWSAKLLGIIGRETAIVGGYKPPFLVPPPFSCAVRLIAARNLNVESAAGPTLVSFLRIVQTS